MKPHPATSDTEHIPVQWLRDHWAQAISPDTIRLITRTRDTGPRTPAYLITDKLRQAIIELFPDMTPGPELELHLSSRDTRLGLRPRVLDPAVEQGQHTIFVHNPEQSDEIPARAFVPTGWMDEALRRLAEHADEEDSPVGE